MNIVTAIAGQLNNQVVTGGLVLLCSGAVMGLLRATPARIFNWAVRRITVDVEILNSDPLFDFVTFWLDAQPYSKRSRTLTATTINVIGGDDGHDNAPAMAGETREAKKPRVFLSPAPGRHVFFHRGRLLWLNRHRENASPGSDSASRLMAGKKHESYVVTLVGRRQSCIREMIEEIVDFGHQPAKKTIKVYNSCFGYWNCGGAVQPRSINSVVLPSGVAEGVIEDARHFLGKSDWYRSVGIPWHRAYLLHGIPGSGKTSLVSALAGELAMDLYVMNVGGSGMDDERLSSLMADVRSGTIVLMEDVDCTFPTRETQKTGEKRVTLSGMLNCLDGVQSREGCLIFMTTNHPEVLDPALTRPGRVDVRVAFDIATVDQVLRLRDRLAPVMHEDRAVIERCAGMTMAEAQQFFLEHASTCSYLYISVEASA